MNHTGSPLPNFDVLITEIRPRLRRYCARMTGSVIDGEDVVQEALLKALEATRSSEPVAHPQSWLFRIAHNAALDHLRGRARHEARFTQEDVEMIADPFDEAASSQAAAATFSTFMHLTVSERSSVILKDVLGHSLEEIASITGTTVPAVKAALHRGRTRLRTIALSPHDTPPPAMTEEDRVLLTAYVDRFNDRDFDAVRRMVAEDARVDLVGRTRLQGRSNVSRYFGNYESRPDWRLSIGLVDGRPAVLVRHTAAPQGRPNHFALIEFKDGLIAEIRDYLYAADVVVDAEIVAAG